MRVLDSRYSNMEIRLKQQQQQQKTPRGRTKSALSSYVASRPGKLKKIWGPHLRKANYWQSS